MNILQFFRKETVCGCDKEVASLRRGYTRLLGRIRELEPKRKRRVRISKDHFEPIYPEMEAASVKRSPRANIHKVDGVSRIEEGQW